MYTSLVLGSTAAWGRLPARCLLTPLLSYGVMSTQWLGMFGSSVGQGTVSAPGRMSHARLVPERRQALSVGLVPVQVPVPSSSLKTKPRLPSLSTTGKTPMAGVCVREVPNDWPPTSWRLVQLASLSQPTPVSVVPTGSQYVGETGHDLVPEHVDAAWVEGAGSVVHDDPVLVVQAGEVVGLMTNAFVQVWPPSVDWLIAIPLGKALQVLSSKTSELAYAM